MRHPDLMTNFPQVYKYLDNATSGTGLNVDNWRIKSSDDNLTMNFELEPSGEYPSVKVVAIFDIALNAVLLYHYINSETTTDTDGNRTVTGIAPAVCAGANSLTISGVTNQNIRSLEITNPSPMNVTGNSRTISGRPIRNSTSGIVQQLIWTEKKPESGSGVSTFQLGTGYKPSAEPIIYGNKNQLVEDFNNSQTTKGELLKNIILFLGIIIQIITASGALGSDSVNPADTPPPDK